MRQFFAPVLSLLLMGCYPDQKQQLAKCEIEADSRPIGNDANFEFYLMETGRRMERCMRGAGYELALRHCVTSKSAAELAERGMRLAQLENLRRSRPSCYEPMGWFGKQSLKLEMKMGWVND